MNVKDLVVIVVPCVARALGIGYFNGLVRKWPVTVT